MGLAIVTILGLIARVGFAALVVNGRRLVHDAPIYVAVAQNVAHGRGFTFHGEVTAAHPPLFILELAGLDRLGIDTVQGQRVALAVISTACVPIIGLVGHHLRGPRLGLFAAAIAAVHPLWIQPPGIIMSESLYLVVVSALLLVAVRAVQTRRLSFIVATGVALGLCALTRSDALVLIALIGLPVAWLSASAAGNRLRNAAIVFVAAGVVMAPWLLRDHAAFGAWTLSTQSGVTLAGSNCDSTYHGRFLGSFDLRCTYGAFAKAGVRSADGADAAENDTKVGRVGIRYARHHARRLPLVVAARNARTWGLFPSGDELRFAVIEGRDRPTERAGYLLQWVLLPLALLGVWAVRSRWREWLVVWAAPVAAVLIATAVYGSTRLRVVAEPSLALLAAAGIVAVTGALRSWRSSA